MGIELHHALADHSRSRSFANESLGTWTNSSYDLVHFIQTHFSAGARRFDGSRASNAKTLSLSPSKLVHRFSALKDLKQPVCQTILMIIKSDDCISHCELLKSQHGYIEIKIPLELNRELD